MPEIELAVALWNRDTFKKQMGTNPQRVQALQDAIEACDMQFGRILNRNQAIKGIFLSPEYYFAGDKAGLGKADGSFHERCISEADKDGIVASMLALSRRFPKVLIIPGTIAWSKSLVRAPGQEFKRDPETNQRTAVLKTTATRIEALRTTLQASYNAGGSVGGRMPTELLKTRVRQDLAAGSPNGLVSPGDVAQVVNAIMSQPLALIDATLIDVFGTNVGMYKTNPNQVDSWNLIAAGTATSVMKNTAFLFLNGRIRFKYNKRNDYHEAVSETGSIVFCPGVKSGYTTIEGIDIGIEICLDHAVGQLINTPLPASGQPMIHIVTSAAVQPSPSPVRLDGYFIHASSNAGWAMVSKNSAAGWVAAEHLEQKNIGGDPLDIYKIKLTVP
jgi:hypothetical protein